MTDISVMKLSNFKFAGNIILRVSGKELLAFGGNSTKGAKLSKKNY